MRKNLLLLAIIFVSLNLFAREINLDDIINEAFVNNKDIKKAKLDLEDYKLQVREAVNIGLPKLDYSGILNTGSAELNGENTIYSHSFKVTQPVYAGGIVIAGIKASKSAKDLAEFSLKQKGKDISIQIVEDYVNILKFQKSREILKNSLKELKENYKTQEELYSLDVITKTTVLEMKYRIIELETSIIEIENALEISKLSLKNKIGIPNDEEIVLKKVDTSLEKASEIDFKTDLEKGLNTNLNVKMLKITSKLQKESEKIQRAELLPKVNFQFEYGGRDSDIGKSIDLGEWDWSGTLAVTVNLWDWGKNYKVLKRSQNKTEKTKYSEKIAIEGIELSIRNSYLELLRLEKLIEARKEALESAKENYKLEKDRFDARLITATEFLTVENKLRSSKIELSSTELDYYTAYKKYKDLIN